MLYFFFFTPPAPTEIYTLSLHDALPICSDGAAIAQAFKDIIARIQAASASVTAIAVSAVSELRSENFAIQATDRKSTRLNSSHVRISYAVFCLKKKKQKQITPS